MLFEVWVKKAIPRKNTIGNSRQKRAVAPPRGPLLFFKSPFTARFFIIRLLLLVALLRVNPRGTVLKLK